MSAALHTAEVVHWIALGVMGVVYTVRIKWLLGHKKPPGDKSAPGGSGRTSAGIVVLKEVMARGGSTLYLQESEILDLLDQEEYQELVYGVDVLLVDNVGSSDSRYRPPVIELVRRRANNCMSVIAVIAAEALSPGSKYASMVDILKRSGVVLNANSPPPPSRPANPTQNGSYWDNKIKDGSLD